MSKSPTFKEDAPDHELNRQTRGLAIASAHCSTIKRINKLRYKVKSQSDEKKWYEVTKQYGHNIGGHEEGEWTCACPDFEHRHLVCKHIYAVCLSKELRRKIVSEDVIQSSTIPLSKESIECPKCKSFEIGKDGRRFNKSGLIQKYLCQSCDYRFVINVGFEHSKKNPKVICAAIELYFKGVSLRKSADHIKQFYGVKIDNTSVLRWIRRFAEVVSPFVDTLTSPNLSGIYHVDEMLVHTKREKMEWGHYQWLWNLMDDTTRFWLSSMVSQWREVTDARAVFQDSKKRANRPKAIIHDGLRSYDEAFQKEYFSLKQPRVKNVRSVSVRHDGLNSKVERLHGTIREREKVMRGMQTKATAQQIIEAIRINYNFIREHSTIKTTPAAKAGIKLELGEKKIENLVRMAATFKRAQK
jgi:putative transposase